MVIKAYQVNNVLRVYRDQLRQSRVSTERKSSDTELPDRIGISAKARRNKIIDNITANIVDKITQYGPYNKVEKEVFEKLESEYGGNLAISEDNPNGFIFKEIDENGETINSLSIEDSKFLTNKLKEITKETIDKNMK
ncbi:MAG: DVU0524 family FlgM-associated protein [Desulfobacterales bacterium]